MVHDKLIGEHDYDELPVDKAYTASYLTAIYLRDVFIPKVMEEEGLIDGQTPGVFVIGEQGFKKELAQFGVRVVNEEEDDWNKD